MRKRPSINVHGKSLTLIWLLAISVASSLLPFAPPAVAGEGLDQEPVEGALHGDVVAVKAILDRGADQNAKD